MKMLGLRISQEQRIRRHGAPKGMQERHYTVWLHAAVGRQNANEVR